MLTYRVSAFVATIRNATETNTANTTETTNAVDIEAAYRRSFAYFSGVNDATFSVRKIDKSTGEIDGEWRKRWPELDSPDEARELLISLFLLI